MKTKSLTLHNFIDSPEIVSLEKQQNTKANSPGTPFFLYKRDVYGKIQDEHPSWGDKDIKDEIYQLWKNLPQVERNKYVRMSNNEVDSFEDEIQKVINDIPTCDYDVFYKEKLTNHHNDFPDGELDKIQGIIDVEWRELSSTERKIYNKKYLESTSDNFWEEIDGLWVCTGKLKPDGGKRELTMWDYKSLIDDVIPYKNNDDNIVIYGKYVVKSSQNNEPEIYGVYVNDNIKCLTDEDIEWCDLVKIKYNVTDIPVPEIKIRYYYTVTSEEFTINNHAQSTLRYYEELPSDWQSIIKKRVKNHVVPDDDDWPIEIYNVTKWNGHEWIIVHVDDEWQDI